MGCPNMPPTSMPLLTSSCDNKGSSGTEPLPVPRLSTIPTPPPQLLAQFFFFPHNSDHSCRHGGITVRIPTPNTLHPTLHHTTTHPHPIPAHHISPSHLLSVVAVVSLLLLLLRLLLSVLFSALSCSSTSHSHSGAWSWIWKESTPVVRQSFTHFFINLFACRRYWRRIS
jgi:hypothetical protein